MSRALADILLKDKVINDPQHGEAIAASKIGKSYIRFLLEKKYLDETKLLYYLSQKFGLPSINIAKFDIKPEIINLLTPDLVKKNGVVPIQSNQGTLVVAVCDPTVISQLENLRFALKMNVEPVLTTYSAFDGARQKYYGGVAAVGAALATYKRTERSLIDEGGGIELVEVHDVDNVKATSEAPIIQLVNGILSEGMKNKASDIHIEPYEKRFRVRMRMDGVLQEIAEIPLELKRAMIARLKVMSRMDISESRVPQDGRIKLRASGAEMDFRVNSMPTLWGEKIVLRLLSQGNLQLNLMKLGFETRQLEVFKKGIHSSNGMVLVTGPTGSGKTTTLYSALSELNQVSENISTAEDPVEYNLEGVNQVQVQKDAGLTFPSVLRALLRQDPDIILVGEIRDLETAEVAIQAALTGHLVLSTLHTNDAPSTITRLLNMGVAPFLVVGALNTIVAQRLLRTICPDCKIADPHPKERLLEVGFSKDDVDRVHGMRGKGCGTCNQTGYKGRVAIYEVLDFTPALKELVLKNTSIIEIKKQAIKEGMKTLRWAALTKMAEGKTTLDEALSGTMEH